MHFRRLAVGAPVPLRRVAGLVALLVPSLRAAQAQLGVPVGSPPVRPALTPGVPLRLVVVDTLGFPRGNTVAGQIAARFVAFDTGLILVRLAAGGEFGVPPSNVRRLYVSQGRGFCRSGASNRAVCLAAGAGTGFVLGALFGHVLGSFPGATDGGAELRRSERTCAAIGAGMGFGITLAFGRERWVRVAGWPPTRS